MLQKRKIGLLLILAAILTVLVVACQPQVVEKEVTRVVTEQIEVAGEQVEVTRVVVETQTVVETVEVPSGQEDSSMGPADMMAPDPTTYTQIVFGDLDTMDPNLAYDTASGGLLRNVMEPLIYYNYSNC